MLACTALFSISIHALREEGDILDNYGFAVATDFYPRPPRGGRQRDVLGTFATPGISIHALREEGDAQLKKRQTVREKFLSTPSARRATPVSDVELRRQNRFLSTPSARRATETRLLFRPST